MDPGRAGGERVRGRARGRGGMAPQPVGAYPPPQEEQHEEDVSSAEMARVSIQDMGGHSQEVGRGQGKQEDPRFTREFAEKRWKDMQLKRAYLRTRREELTDKKGTSGQPVDLIANYFPVDLRRMETWHLNMYQVDYEPDEDSGKIRKRVLRKAAEQVSLANYIFDGFHQLYTIEEMDVDPKLVEVEYKHDDGTSVPFRITLKKVKQIPWNDAETLQVYNIVMRTVMQRLELVQLGRSYFSQTMKVELHHRHMELWPGFTTALRPYEHELMMNVETITKVIMTQSVLATMNQIRNDVYDRSKVREECEKKICDRIVLTHYTMKTYKIGRIEWDMRPTDTFSTKKGDITFQEYYKSKYDLPIDPKQPLLVAVPKQRDVARGVNLAETMLIPELCFLTGLTEEMRNDGNLMKELTSHTKPPAMQRVRQLSEFMTKVCRHPELSKDLSEKWGIRYPTNELKRLGGRLLPAERILFGNQLVYDEKRGEWGNALHSKKLFSPTRCANWAIIVSQRDMRNVDGVIRTLIQVAGQCSYNISNPERFVINSTRPADYEREIDNIVGKCRGNIDLIMAILPNKSLDNYAAVKTRCTVKYGVLSQCWIAKNSTACPPHKIKNICTKVMVQMCAKQGGVPWTVSWPLKTQMMMVVGYDVFHSGGLSNKRTMVGALVATINIEQTRYTSVVQRQQTTELSGTMANDFARVLKRCQQFNNGQLPVRILFYRDGVGEGQLSQVVDVELRDIKKSIKDLYNEASQELPKLTYIVVSKRINTRIWQRGRDGPVNPLPGTVVDDVITLPERYDFYMVSATSFQGTVSPTSYNVLFDNSLFSPDKIQIMTWKLCHSYYLTFQSTAVPTVCHYAHRLAFLAGKALGPSGEPHENLVDYLYFI